MKIIFILTLCGFLAPAVWGGEKESYARVWPAAPDEPRIGFVRSISGPADVGIRPSAWSRFASAITGAAKNAAALEKPFGVAVDDAGNLCVTDTGTGALCYFDLRHKKFRQWKRAGTIDFKSPVAVAKRKSDLYVADSQLGEVVAFDEGGRLLFVVSNHLERPVGVALAEDRLFVVDSQLHKVVVFNLQGEFLSEFGQRGVGVGEFNFPTHIAATPRGEILVTDSMNSRVELFDHAGHWQGTIGEPGDSSGHFSRPKGVAMDSSGDVYVLDALFDNLQIFSRAGDFLLDIGRTGTAPGEFWLPAGIAITSDNHIFVADSYNHRVQEFKFLGP